MKEKRVLPPDYRQRLQVETPEHVMLDLEIAGADESIDLGQQPPGLPTAQRGYQQRLGFRRLALDYMTFEERSAMGIYSAEERQRHLDEFERQAVTLDRGHALGMDARQQR